ncbi:hypothetical protein [Kamptonema formosum]|uniref:hypothetical protein n=1 Tax=Kamptonema formosum TaxID=331992 RepID=UPI00034C738D|nr:hypothetical protein [Kamptonema formosum]
MPFDPERNRLQDEELMMLAIEAQRHPPKSRERQLCQNLRHKMYPHLNFQSLAIRILAREKWREISADLGIPISTLSSFYQRSIRELSPHIKLYLNR